jgi:hypothetical protein
MLPLKGAAVLAVTVAAGAALIADSGDAVFGLTKVHQVNVTVAPAEWTVLQTSSARGGTGAGGSDYVAADGRLIHVGGGFRGYFPWVHADLSLAGTRFKDIGLRYKGNFSFSSSSASNPFRANFKVKLDLFDSKADWDGLETLNFHAGVLDTSLMREALAFSVFRAAGLPAPRTAYARLMFNVAGTYDNVPGGLYVLIENVNKQFLKNVLPPGTGLLMKPEGLRGGVLSYGDNWSAYIANYRPDRDATPQEQQRVIEFAKLVSQNDVALFRSRISSFLDVDSFLRYLAVNAFLVNGDSYLGGSHNFYLYLDPKDDKFRFIPWDEDLSMGTRGNAAIDLARPLRNENALIYWLLDDPAVSARYRAILKELSTSAFSRAELVGTLDALEKTTGSSAAPLRAFLESRISYLQQVIGQ